jgi:hypothetical protein
VPMPRHRPYRSVSLDHGWSFYVSIQDIIKVIY